MRGVIAAVPHILPCKHSRRSAALAQIQASRKGRAKQSETTRKEERQFSPYLLFPESQSGVSLASYPMSLPFERSHSPFPPPWGSQSPSHHLPGPECQPGCWHHSQCCCSHVTLLLNGKLCFPLLDELSRPWKQGAVVNPPSWDSQVQESPLCDAPGTLPQGKVRAVSLLSAQFVSTSFLKRRCVGSGQLETEVSALHHISTSDLENIMCE